MTEIATTREQVLLNLAKEIPEWKKAFGRVLLVEILGRCYVYRPLNRLEWKAITDNALKQAGQDPLAVSALAQEITAQKAVLYPPTFGVNIGIVPAGVVSRLSEEIMKASGFDRENEEAPIEL